MYMQFAHNPVFLAKTHVQYSALDVSSVWLETWNCHFLGGIQTLDVKEPQKVLPEKNGFVFWEMFKYW